MNTGKKRILRGLIATLITISAVIGLSACENHKDLKPIPVQEVIMRYDFQDKYGYAMGLKHIFVVYGEHKGFHAGEAIDPINKSVNSYSIKDLLDKYPNLRTPQAIEAARKQGNISFI